VKQDLLATIQFPLPGAQNGTPPPTGSSAPVSCEAVYSLTNSWPGGFQAQVVLTNTGTTAISPWQLVWTFPGDQQISSLWDASYVQSGEHVTATAESYNSTIAPSASVTVGFTGSYTNSDASPTSFTVNGTACAT
jgi:cellulase/cellobiase CelA1